MLADPGGSILPFCRRMDHLHSNPMLTINLPEIALNVILPFLVRFFVWSFPRVFLNKIQYAFLVSATLASQMLLFLQYCLTLILIPTFLVVWYHLVLSFIGTINFLRSLFSNACNLRYFLGIKDGALHSCIINGSNY